MGKIKLQKIVAGMPIGVVATCVGASTLSGIYYELGYSGVRHITMILSFFIWIGAMLKIIFHFKVVKEEYDNVVTCSLYASIPMLTMALGQYIAAFNYTVGKLLWLTAVLVHFIHIIRFTYKNIIRRRELETFVPSWFVTYNGFLTAIVTGTSMNEPKLCKLIVYYGLAIFLIFMPVMTIRVLKYPINNTFLHTKAIMLSPPSLCLVGYLGFIEKPVFLVVLVLYLSLLGTLFYIFYNFSTFFSVKFYPGFSGLTFPMAIGVVASGKMSEYLIGNGMVFAGKMAREIQGIQFFVTTVIIAFIGYHFLRELLKYLKNIML